MYHVTPVSQSQYRAEYRKACNGRRMKVWSGVCPICGKGTGGNAVYVYAMANGATLLTEQEARDVVEAGGTLVVEPVGKACHAAHLGSAYTVASDLPAEHRLSL
jgi:hypothetical protein